MPWSIAWHETAEADLDAIWLYMAKNDLAAADRQLTRIIEAVEKLAEFPHLGPERSDIEPGLRGLTRGNHLVLYEILETERRVAILRIIHGRRDIGVLFRQSE